MKDICALRYRSESRIVPEQVRAVVGALMLPGERMELHRVDDRTSIVEVHRSARRSTESQVLVSSGSAWAYSGHVQPRFSDLRSRSEQITVTGETIRLAESPGGIAAHFCADRESGQLFAWPSLSNWERVFYTAAPDLVVVSNSALLSHCLAENTTSPQMNPAWLEDVLIGMGSIFDHTQFARTLAVPSRRTLRVSRDGTPALGDYPLHVARHTWRKRSDAAVDELAHELIAAASPLIDPQKTVLRLSGGKDSRLIAALLHSIGFVPKTVTSGVPGINQAAVAERLAGALGLPHETTHSPQCEREAILENIREQARNADFAHLAGQQLVKPRGEYDPFDTVVEGHAHHLRGGYGKRREVSAEQGFRLFWDHLSAGSEFAFVSKRRQKRAELRSVFDAMLEENSPREALYWAYVDRRVLLTQQPYRRKRAIFQVPPLMDDRVLLATSKAHIADLGSEELAYKLMCRFSPVATQLPMFGKVWRFAAKHAEPGRGQSDAEQSGAGAESRDRSPHKNLSFAVEVLNGLIREGLPFDLRDLTPNQSFHGDTIRIDNVRSNGQPSTKNLDYVWKIISLALSFEPKKALAPAVRVPEGIP